MSRHEGVFVPEPECMVASGECLTIGRCLAKCKSRAFYEHRTDIEAMKRRMTQLELRIINLEKKC